MIFKDISVGIEEKDQEQSITAQDWIDWSTFLGTAVTFQAGETLKFNEIIHRNTKDVFDLQCLNASLDQEISALEAQIKH